MNKINKKLLFAAWTSKNKNYGIFQIFDSPLRKIFTSVESFDPQEDLYKYGKEKMNSNFLKKIKDYKPDFVFIQLIYDEFYLETIKKIKELAPKCKIINFCGDDDTLFYNYSLIFFPFIDYFFITQPSFLKKYSEFKKKAFLILGADSEKFYPIKEKKEYGVVFIGTPKSDRVEYIRFLKKNNINIKVFGGGWEKYKDLSSIASGRVSDLDFLKIINKSKINLIFSKNYEGGTHVLDRLPQITFCNSFALVEYDPGYYDIFKKDKEIVTFKEKEELLKKVKFYLDNEKEREKISSSAYKKSIEKLILQDQIKSAFEFIIKDHVKKEIITERKVLEIDIKDISKIKKVKKYDYITFKASDIYVNKKRNEIQAYQLDKTGSELSCCDYYASKSYLSDLFIFQSKFCYKTNKKEFFSLLNLSQLMFKKDYFNKNIKKIKEGDFESIFNNNMRFVTYPLIRNYKKINIDKDNYDLFVPIFENKLRILKNNKKLIFNPYYISLILYFYFYNKFIFNNIRNKIFR